MAELTPAARRRERGSFFVFNVLNSVSFVLLSGSFVTLLAVRLGASDATLGLLNALSYATFFFMPLGKRLIARHRIISVFAWSWLARYLGLTPILLAPVLAASGREAAAIACVLLGTALFNVFRGVGLIGNNPVLANLAEGRDRGSFIITVQIVNNVAGIGTSLAAALLLGDAAPTGRYALLMASGIAVGVGASLILLNQSEPEAYRPPKGSNAWRTALQAIGERPYRAFLGVFLLLSLAGGAARSFLPVYAKTIYGQGDDLVMAWSLLASLGSVASGLIMKRVVDRIGAKPLYGIFALLSAIALLPAAASPGFASAFAAAVFVGGLNFAVSFGLAGSENAGQTYHFALVPKERTLDLAIVYFVVYGLGGTLGAASGGILLGALGSLGLDRADAFRAFFALCSLGFAAALFGLARLQRLDALPVRETIGILFSPRDLRAFDLLGRLDRSGDPAEEVRLIHELGELATARSAPDLARYLSSPRFEVRIEALLALENLPVLDPSTLKALALEIERNPYSTAYVAARILGKRGGAEVVPLLRGAANADDYMLAGSAVLALARLGDADSSTLIESILSTSDNPRLRIACASALELLGDRRSVPALVASLRRQKAPDFSSDELVLAMAGLLDMLPIFYPIFRAFRGDPREGLEALRALARDRIDGDAEFDAIDFERRLGALFAEAADGAPMAALLGLLGRDEAAELVLAEAILDPSLAYPGLRLFVGAYVAAGGPERP